MSSTLESLMVGVVAARRRARARNTTRAYESRVKAWRRWLDTHAVAEAAVTPEHVAAFLVWVAAEGPSGVGCKAPTVQGYLAALRAHYRRGRGQADITHASVVTETLEGVLRGLGVESHQKAALRPVDLYKLAEVVPGAGIGGVRDWAIVLLTFATGRRAGDILELDLGDVIVGPHGLRLHFRKSKTDQRGEGKWLPVGFGARPDTCPVAAWAAWRAQRGGKKGPAFLAMTRHHKLKPDRRLGFRAFAYRWAAHLEAAGLEAGEYGTHSLRAGFVTTALAAGVSVAQVMQRTEHRDQAQVARYIRPDARDEDALVQKLGM